MLFPLLFCLATGALQAAAAPWLLLPALLLAQAGKAFADAQAHGSPRLLARFPRWAGPDSWRLKYRGGEPAAGRAFPGSTTWLVWLTDLWHFAGAVSWLGWALAAAGCCLAGPAGLPWLAGGLAVGKGGFELLYRWLRK